MIEVFEKRNSTTVELSVFSYGSGVYTVSSNIGIVTGNVIEIDSSATEVEITVDHSGEIEATTYIIKTKNTKFTFSIPYKIPRLREHFYLNGLIRKAFYGWSTAGTTDFSMTSRIFSSVLCSRIANDSTLELMKIDGKVNPFPLETISRMFSLKPNNGKVEERGIIPFTHLENFREIDFTESNLSIGYVTGGTIAVSSESRIEEVTGDESSIYSTELKFGKFTSVNKKGRMFINTKNKKNFIDKDGRDLNIVVDDNKITFRNVDTELFSFYSPIQIDEIIISIFGDVFILSESYIYYAKMEVDLPDYNWLNPSVNNNNIIEITSDYFYPTDEIEVVVDLEYLRNISAKTIIIKIKNQDSEFYIIGDDEVSNTEKRIDVGERKNIKFVIETDTTDRFIQGEVFVDLNSTPYIVFSSAMTLDLKKVNENKYSSIYLYNNRLIASKIIQEAPLEVEDKEIIFDYSGISIEGGEYVSYKA
jgi:hypothetical protein